MNLKQTGFSLFPRRTQSVWMKHSFTYAAMFTRCLYLYKPPVGGVVCMTIATARGLIYEWEEKLYQPGQILSKLVLDPWIKNAEIQKMYRAMKRSSMILPPWFMIFRTMFSAGWHISQTEVYLYLLPTQDLMSSHRVFRRDLIRQHPATFGLVKLLSG